MSDLKIGTTKFDSDRKGAGSGLKEFKLDQGSNLFRLLPPLHSLATEGRYYKYWRVHWGFLASNAKPRPIVCIERKSRDGQITEHCPICDMVEQNKSELEHLKARGVSEEELKSFTDNNISPFEGKGGYYTYAFDTSGNLGVLKLTKTMKDGFEARGKELESEGFEINGIEGVYIDIKKTGTGRFNTKYEVQIAMEVDPNNRGSKRYKTHTLTPELQNKILKETFDLSQKYKVISSEEMSMIVNAASEEQRRTFVDRFMSRGEKKESSGYSAVSEMKVPGQPATFVSTTTVNKSTGSYETTGPNLSKLDKSTPVAAPVAKVEPVSQVAAPSSNLNPNDIKNMSDDDLMKMFQDRFGGTN